MQDELLKNRVSKLFYQRGLSKKEIGEKLRLSRFKVAKLLEDALKEGMVNINIREIKGTYLDLEDALEEKFKIYGAVVTETSIDDDSTKKNIGKAAAGRLIDMVYDNDVIGVAWGTTIFEMVNALPNYVERKNITVVQITGGSNQVSSEINASELTRRMSKIFNSKSYYLHAPAILNSEEAKNILLSETDIKNTFEEFNKINIAVVGIGSIKPEPSTILYRDGFISKMDFESILGSCAVGDINSYFYDKDGNKCSTALDNRAIGMNLDQIRRVRYVIGVAGGDRKIGAIYGALKGKIINLIVIDHETAEKLLKIE